jgi:hypothetical protein
VVFVELLRTLMAHARYKILSDIPGKPLFIRDVGPWDSHRSVTNDAEHVIKELVEQRKLPPGRRLLYWDTDNRLDELLVKDGEFVGFGVLEQEGNS